LGNKFDIFQAKCITIVTINCKMKKKLLFYMNILLNSNPSGQSELKSTKVISKDKKGPIQNTSFLHG